MKLTRIEIQTKDLDWQLLSIMKKHNVVYLSNVNEYFKQYISDDILFGEIEGNNQKGIEKLAQELKRGLEELIAENNLTKEVIQFKEKADNHTTNILETIILQE